jgi:hypothetical protein
MPVAKIEPHKVVHEDHTVLHPPTTLRDKGLSKGRLSPREMEELLGRAELALEALAPSFTEWMQGAAKELAGSFDAYESGPRDEEATRAFFIVAHDVRGQAMQFGYPLAARVCGGLCELLQSPGRADIPLVVFQNYVDAICSFVRLGIRDEGNEVARDLARALDQVLADHRARTKA